MSVTTKHIITARPSMRMPTPNSKPPFCHHVMWCSTGVTIGLPSPLCTKRLRPSAPRPSALPPEADSTRSIHW